VYGKSLLTESCEHVNEYPGTTRGVPFQLPQYYFAPRSNLHEII
jgi:hypothetical protein